MKGRFIVILFVILYCLACRKDDDITSDPSAKLEFSSDSILFDTVFTAAGSVTKKIKIYNRNKQAVQINEIKLFGGPTSNYQININGIAADQVSGIKLRGQDSLNLFVKVTINPNSSIIPFLVKDSIGLITNGNRQKIILSAYGQNAVFLKDAIINSNTTWNNKLPYVILNKVTVSTNNTLTIEKGSKIYFHKDAELVIAGSLKVDGELKDSVRFAGDRLDQVYANESGQWKGLHFLESSKDNHINYALIKNGIVALQVDALSSNTNPKLLLVNTIIRNMEIAGLYCNNTSVTAFNNILTNCGRHLVYAINGGKYDFKQNTLVNLNFEFSRSTPAVFFTDQLTPGKTSDFNLSLINNIIWGNLQDELIVEKKGTLPFVQLIRKNLIKSKDSNLNALGNFINIDPLFKNARSYNFTLIPASPAANKGEDLSSDQYFNSILDKDLNGRARLFPSELGCYELQ